jgi:hypothetical protein
VDTGTVTCTVTPGEQDTATGTCTYTVTPAITPTLPATATFTPASTFTFNSTTTLTLTVTLIPTSTALITATQTITPAPTFTPTPELSNKMEMVGVVIYPNPYSGASGDLKINFDMTRPANKITVRIYTVNYRKVIEKIMQGSYLRNIVLTLQPGAFSRLANGVYYVVVIGENGSERAVSRLEPMIVLR